MATTGNSTTPTCELCGEPATLVGEQWTCASCAPSSEAAHTFSTIVIADIIDQLADAVDAAREAAIDNKAWMRALDAAWDHLLYQVTIAYDLSNWAIRVESATRAGRVYVANGDCQCEAFTKGQGVCWHRAAARLVRRAIERREQAELSALAAELVSDAHDAGCGWYGVAEGLVGARLRRDELAEVVSDWDAGVAAQRAALGARIGRAQAAAMARAA